MLSFRVMLHPYPQVTEDYVVQLKTIKAMKAIEMKAIATPIAKESNSMKEVSNHYSVLKEKYGQEDAKAIVNLAKEIKRKEFEVVDVHKKSLVESIDGERVLRAVFADLKKDKDWKWLAGKAECKAGGVMELVAKWYPDTIEGMPARKVWVDESKTVRIWTEKPITKSNAAQILITCIRAIAKAAKHQKSGTVEHVEGEQVA